MNFTNGEIDRLGNTIREEGFELSETTLEKLQLVRTSHKDSIAPVFQILCRLSKQVNLSSIVTYRIKRFQSIISKLHRHPEMRFSRMGDIGGCRCIVRSNEEIYRLVELIEKNLHVRGKKDYIKDPQPDGYKSYHLFVSLKGDNKIIEVQLRNRSDHNWATLVEISDLLFDAKLKEYGHNKELLKFHLLLSKKENLTTSDRAYIANIIEVYDYIEQLSQVFSRNYIEVRRQWLLVENRSNYKFFLIEANKDQIPQITPFTNFNDAEERYFSIYRSDPHANVVITHLTKPRYNQICLAYSNYMLTYHSFIDDWSLILEGLLIDCLQRGKLRKTVKYYKQYVEITYNHYKTVHREILEARSFGRGRPRPQNLSKKEREWLSDIETGIKRRREQQLEFYRVLGGFFPNRWISRLILNIGFNSVNNTYKGRFKRVTNNIAKNNLNR